MISYDPFYSCAEGTPLRPCIDAIRGFAQHAIDDSNHGDLEKWRHTLRALPAIMPSHTNLNTDAIQIGAPHDCSDAERKQLEELLMVFHPWRKGPFNVFGIHIDTEWRSDFKWNRLIDAISPLTDRLVLDIGCGSGYHCLRMCGADARCVLGIDPTLLYVMQFYALTRYLSLPHAAVLPIGIDDMPHDTPAFDTVFSMGILYHRRSPIDHIIHTKELLRDGGELVLETLVVEGDAMTVCMPEGRYAKMPNVWFIPSVSLVERWLTRAGFSQVRTVDVTRTTSDEQRVTPWMGFESLEHFLDPQDTIKTIEGYPAPVRAIFVAQK